MVVQLLLGYGAGSNPDEIVYFGIRCEPALVKRIGMAGVAEQAEFGV